MGETKLANPYPGSGCFFCGPHNPIGLKLTFFETSGEPKELVCHWKPPEDYRGMGRVLHGGIQSGLFDEIMGWTTHRLMNMSAVTGEIHVRFRRPVFVGEELTVRCRIDRLDGRDVHLSAEIHGPDNTVRSEATGAYVLIPEDRIRQAMGGQD